MVRIFVDHDLVSIPVPVRDDAVIERSDVPVEIAKPEAFPVSACKHEYMLRSKAAGEMSVGPWVIQVVMRIVRAGIMSHPFIVPGVNVRQVRMTFLVHMNAVLGHGSVLVPSDRGRGPGRRRGSRTVSGNVPAANLRGVTAMRFAAAPFSCAKAAMQIRTARPRIFFTKSSRRNLAMERSALRVPPQTRRRW